MEWILFRLQISSSVGKYVSKKENKKGMRGIARHTLMYHFTGLTLPKLSFTVTSYKVPPENRKVYFWFPVYPP